MSDQGCDCSEGAMTTVAKWVVAILLFSLLLGSGRACNDAHQPKGCVLTTSGWEPYEGTQR